MAIYFTMQSSLHVAVIMDGNGRWALARGLPRIAGHKAGVETARRVVEEAPELGIGTLTLFAFSSDNWKRPPEEVSTLMGLLLAYLEAETHRAVMNGVRLEVIGRRDRLGRVLAGAIRRTEAATAGGTRLHVRLAVDYSSRDAIVSAARAQADVSREGLGLALGPPVDLMIRTGGEQRLSDFLLWEAAYAELVFSRTMWPDFAGVELARAVHEFRGRERRFGAVPQPVVRQREAWLE